MTRDNSVLQMTTVTEIVLTLDGGEDTVNGVEWYTVGPRGRRAG